MTRCRRPALLAGAAMSLTLSLAGCAAEEVVVPGSSPAGGPAVPIGAPAAPSGVRFPVVPAIVIPDVTALTKSADRFAAALGDLATPASGVSVLGARCDPSGKVVNRAGLTRITNGDGSGTFTDHALTVTNDGNGSGTYRDDERVITVNSDGSGTYSDPERTITISADGSGTYSDSGQTITVNDDGSGTYRDAERVITVSADGSGTVSDAEHTMTVDNDGSGTYSDAGQTVINNGDGTGLVDGVVTVMPPLDPIPLLGTFPRADALAPIGQACGTLIRLDERVLFDFDQDVLRPEAGPVLDRLARAFIGVDRQLAINGHTDGKGADAYNLDLSRRRAAAVLDGLQQRGVGAPMQATGYGETQPIAANEVGGRDDPAGRRLNRRVEIVIPG